MTEWSKFQIGNIVPRHLFNSEIERLIINYCEENNLILPKDFARHHYEFYTRQDTHFMGHEYSIVFKALVKNDDDILREQIEFQIQQLEQ